MSLHLTKGKVVQLTLGEMNVTTWMPNYSHNV